MNKTLLLVIDVQNNFINKKTKFIIKRVQNVLKSNKFDVVAFTKFINSKNCNFYKILNYRGCIKAEDHQISIETYDKKVFEKETYTALNDELKQFIKDNNIKQICLCGIDTDACVLKTALDLFDNGYLIKVIEDCSMSHSGKKYHKMAIKLLKKLIGKENIIKVLKD